MECLIKNVLINIWYVIIDNYEKQLKSSEVNMESSRDYATEIINLCKRQWAI